MPNSLLVYASAALNSRLQLLGYTKDNFNKRFPVFKLSTVACGLLSEYKELWPKNERDVNTVVHFREKLLEEKGPSYHSYSGSDHRPKLFGIQYWVVNAKAQTIVGEGILSQDWKFPQQIKGYKSFYTNCSVLINDVVLPLAKKSIRPSSSSYNICRRDGVYVAYANGNVRDTRTGLEWKVGPDRAMGYNEACLWVKSQRSLYGDWRMPTMDELEGLYQKGKGDRNMTPLLKTSGWLVCSGETRGCYYASFFNFGDGQRRWREQNYSGRDTDRAFAVRSRGAE